MSATDCQDYARVQYVPYEQLSADDIDTIWTIASRLERDLGLVANPPYNANALRSTYAGLVWETRRGHVQESRWIDALVDEWETTTVDFKRELHTKTADQKAELIKDLLGLANTKASGRRWLIIGFDDKTRRYHGPPSERITQDHLENILGHYTAPVLSVKYEVVDYRSGPVGKIEILRDPAHVPYRVAHPLGDRKRITKGQVFVRHGSQTEEPTPAELAALEDEASRTAFLDGQPRRP